MKYILGSLIGYAVGLNWGRPMTEWSIMPPSYN
jgi:hypothetical protein